MMPICCLQYTIGSSSIAQNVLNENLQLMMDDADVDADGNVYLCGK
jgi:hypothetical protein